MGNLKLLIPQLLKCFIASSIKCEDPKLYRELSKEGLILSQHKPPLVAEDDSEIAVNLVITDVEEVDEYQELSDSIGKLVDACDAENKTTLSTSLRYIKADIDVGIRRFMHQNGNRER